MKREQQALGPRPLATVGDLADHLMENVVGDRPRGSGPCHRGRREVVAEPLRSDDEAPHFMMRVAPNFEEFLALREAPFLEPPPIGWERDEGVRLMHESADGDPH